MFYHPPCPAGDAAFIYLVRHGATANNLEKPPRLQGRKVDLGLSPAGRIQAEATANALSKHSFAGVYASPLLRARETAECIARPHKLTVQTIDALAEADVGAWENRTWPEIERDFPDEHRRFMTDSAVHGYRDGENLTQVHGRVVPALDALAAEHAGRMIVVVAHNVVNRVFLGCVLGIPISQARRISQENCGVNIVRYRGGEAKLVTYNAAFHLENW